MIRSFIQLQLFSIVKRYYKNFHLKHNPGNTVLTVLYLNTSELDLTWHVKTNLMIKILLTRALKHELCELSPSLPNEGVRPSQPTLSSVLDGYWFSVP